MKKQIIGGLGATLLASAAQAVIVFPDVPAGAEGVAGANDTPVTYASEINVSNTTFANTQLFPTTNPAAGPSAAAWGNLTVLIPSVQGLGNGENTRLRLDIAGQNPAAGTPTFANLDQNNLVVYGKSPGAVVYTDQRPEATTSTRQCAANISVAPSDSSVILDINCEQGINIDDYFAVTFNVLLPSEQCVDLTAGRYHTVQDASNQTGAFYVETENLFCFEEAVTFGAPEKLHPVDFINPGDEDGTAQDPVAGVRNSFMYGNAAGIIANGGDDAEQEDNTPVSSDMSFSIASDIFWNTGEELSGNPGLVLGRLGDGGADFTVWGDFSGFDRDGINIDDNGSTAAGTSVPATSISHTQANFNDVTVTTADPISFELNPEGLPAIGFSSVGIPGEMNAGAFHVESTLSQVNNGDSIGFTDGDLDATDSNTGPGLNAVARASSEAKLFDRAFMSEIELGGAVDQANYLLRATNTEGGASSPFTTFLRITNDTNCPADIYFRMIDDAGNSAYFELAELGVLDANPDAASRLTQGTTLARYASTNAINADRFYDAAAAASAQHGYDFDVNTRKARLEVVSTYPHSTEARPNAFSGSGTTAHNGEPDNATGGTEDDYGFAQANTEGFPAVDVQAVLRSADGNVFTFSDTSD